jgi:Ca2+-binding EF-hand superfamily protein
MDAFINMNAQRSIADNDVKKFLGIIDKNSDGKITKG